MTSPTDDQRAVELAQASDDLAIIIAGGAGALSAALGCHDKSAIIKGFLTGFYRAHFTSLSTRLDHAKAEAAVLREAMTDFLRNGTKLVGNPPQHIVIEHADNSDPHYKLCEMWGKNNSWSGIAPLATAFLAEHEKMKAELAAAKANQRTPGTVEVCDRYLSGNTCDAGNRGTEFDDCRHDLCPLRAKEHADG